MAQASTSRWSAARDCANPRSVRTSEISRDVSPREPIAGRRQVQRQQRVRSFQKAQPSLFVRPCVDSPSEHSETTNRVDPRHEAPRRRLAAGLQARGTGRSSAVRGRAPAAWPPSRPSQPYQTQSWRQRLAQRPQAKSGSISCESSLSSRYSPFRIVRYKDVWVEQWTPNTP
jgi:hypothetical protein